MNIESKDIVFSLFDTPRLLCWFAESVQLAASVPPVLTEDMLCEKRHDAVVRSPGPGGLYSCSGAVTYLSSKQEQETFYSFYHH